MSNQVVSYRRLPYTLCLIANAFRRHAIVRTDDILPGIVSNKKMKWKGTDTVQMVKR
jgi:hypothetical protein